MCFLVGLVEKMVPGSVVGCAENIVNTMVFIKSHFFTYFSELVDIRLTVGVFLLAFGVLWAHFF